MMPANHDNSRRNAYTIATIILCLLSSSLFIAPSVAAAQSTGTSLVTGVATGLVSSAVSSLAGSAVSSVTSLFGGSSSSGGSNSSSNAVPVADVLNNPNQSFLKEKGNTLDSLAYGLAQVVLHQVTSSVVNWINSGFGGNPSFLTNPTAYFLNSADQITGSFLSSGGPLSNLCSPFALDVRLSLALGEADQTGSGGQAGNYSCSLSTIIQNVSNPSVGVSVGSSANGATLGDLTSGGVLNNSNQLSVNGQSVNNTGASINGFLSGDFSQGGWPAFIAMTTEPENNIYGAYYEAGSDLQQQIQTNQNSINSDLNRSNGFLSWSSCQDVSNSSNVGQQLGLSDQQMTQLGNTGQLTGSSGTQYSTRVDPTTGSTVYQTCTVQTPGSVIHDSLQQSLGSSVSNLVSIHDFNEIVNSLFSSLLTKVLSGGLNAASNGPSGGQAAGIATQIENDQDTAQIAADQQQLTDNIGTSLSTGQQTVQLEEQAVQTLAAIQALYQSDLNCFTAELNSTTTTLTASTTRIANQGINDINNTLNTLVDPAIAKYQANVDTASSSLGTLEGVQSDGQNAQSLNDVNNAANAFNQLVNNNDLPQVADVQTAQSDLSNAQTAAAPLNADALKYQNECILAPQ